MKADLRLLANDEVAPPSQVAASRRTILVSAAGRVRRRPSPWRSGVLLALFAPAAWAATTALLGRGAPPDQYPPVPQRVPQRTGDAPRPLHPPAHAELGSSREPASLQPASERSERSEISDVVLAPRAGGQVDALPRTRPATPAAKPSELDAIERAHRTHRHDRALQRALTLYEQHLRDFPSGQFVLEARWGRALVLEELGRTRDARAAFEAFARGDFGEYRRADAQAKLSPQK